MRCSCRNCGTYMIQAEGTRFGCVCPECLNRCRDCMGTGTVISREDLASLALRRMAERPETENDEVEEESFGPVTDADWID